jgi:hypothetical protein
VDRRSAAGRQRPFHQERRNAVEQPGRNSHRIVLSMNIEMKDARSIVNNISIFIELT